MIYIHVQYQDGVGYVEINSWWAKPNQYQAHVEFISLPASSPGLGAPCSQVAVSLLLGWADIPPAPLRMMMISWNSWARFLSWRCASLMLSRNWSYWGTKYPISVRGSASGRLLVSEALRSTTHVLRQVFRGGNRRFDDLSTNVVERVWNWCLWTEFGVLFYRTSEGSVRGRDRARR